ncbi:MAG: FtsX-like permease family protein [Proteobacteria bacterium]|nr:FtsX-like permease family protein [Pseudomonadota bacterium]
MIGRIFSLALKNVFRARTRTLITVFAYAIGIGMYILLDGLLAGVYKDSVKNIVQKDIGNVKIFSRGCDINRIVPDPGNYFGENVYGQVSERYKYSVPELQFLTGIVSGEQQYAGVVRGVDSKSANTVFNYKADIKVGSWLDSLPDDEVVMGELLAKILGLNVGDNFTVVYRNRDGNYDAYDFTIGGLIYTGNPNVDRIDIFMKLKKAQQMMGAEGLLSDIALRTNDKSAVEKLNRDLEGKVIAYSWEDLSQDFLNINKTKKISSMVLIMMVVVVAVIGIFNTILLGMFERQREIGTLKAFGMEEREINLLFITEGGIIGLLGSIIGIVTGIILNIPFVTIGINLKTFENMDIGYPVEAVFKSTWNPGSMIFALIFGVIVAILASYYPAKRAAKLNPVETLRE